MGGCIFCAVIAGQAEAFVIARDPHALAFLDINPIGRGHSLVVPTRHVDDLRDGGAEALIEVAALVDEVSRLLVDRLGADGINLFHSTGKAAGQEVFHFHMHLLPRWEGDGVLRNLVGARAGSTDLPAVHQAVVG